MSLRPQKTTHWIFLLLFVVSAAMAPGAALEHGLSHLEENFASSAFSELGFQSLGDPAGDPEANCELCDALTNGRDGISLVFDGISDSIEVDRGVDAPESLLLPRLTRYAPESQRAPPLS